MKRIIDPLRSIAIFLLIFLVIVAIALWFLDLVAQQRVFGFLMSAELVAFAMLVYIFYEENPVVRKKLLTAGFVALGILVFLAAIVFAGVGSSLTTACTQCCLGICSRLRLRDFSFCLFSLLREFG